MAENHPPEPVKIGSFPRDDVRWPQDGDQRGTAYVYAPEDPGAPVFELHLGDPGVELIDSPVGSVFTVRVTGGVDRRAWEETYRLRVTGDDDDTGEYTVGPGLVAERGRWGRTTHSGFEFGVLVMGAVPAD
jgi:hypothetical protein